MLAWGFQLVTEIIYNLYNIASRTDQNARDRKNPPPIRPLPRNQLFVIANYTCYEPVSYYNQYQ